MALHTEISTIQDPSLRVEVMKHNIEFESDPIGFREKFKQPQEGLMEKMQRAKTILPKVNVSDQLFEVVARMCISLHADGHRPDIMIVKSAKALAAFNGRTEVEPQDLLDSAVLAVSHRTRNLGMDPPASESQIEDEFKKALSLVTGRPG